MEERINFENVHLSHLYLFVQEGVLIGQYPRHHGGLARVDSNGTQILGKNAAEMEKRQMLEAREFILKSLQFGCKQREMYRIESKR